MFRGKMIVRIVCVQVALSAVECEVQWFVVLCFRQRMRCVPLGLSNGAKYREEHDILVVYCGILRYPEYMAMIQIDSQMRSCRVMYKKEKKLLLD